MKGNKKTKRSRSEYFFYLLIFMVVTGLVSLFVLTRGTPSLPTRPGAFSVNEAKDYLTIAEREARRAYERRMPEHFKYSAIPLLLRENMIRYLTGNYNESHHASMFFNKSSIWNNVQVFWENELELIRPDSLFHEGKRFANNNESDVKNYIEHWDIAIRMFRKHYDSLKDLQT